MKIIKRDGTKEDIKLDKVTRRVQYLCTGLKIDPIKVSQKAVSGLYDGITSRETDELLAETAALMVQDHPNYAKLAGRIFVTNLHKETSGFYETAKALTKQGIMSKEFSDIVSLHGKKLEKLIDYERDLNFDYFGLKTLAKSYLLKDKKGRILERPQDMYMRVAVFIARDNIEEIESLYNSLSLGEFSLATPTMFNAGLKCPQMSSCFLMGIEDSISGIYKGLSDCAEISKMAGGIGIHISDIRASGANIKGTNGVSNGIVPMLKVFNETARYVDQGGGKRKGGFAVYIEPWHDDIDKFLDMKLPTGKEEFRARDLFYALWVPDLFMERIEADGDWSLFCPSEAKGLSEVYGNEFKALYEKYEADGLTRRTIKARDLWTQVLNTQIKTGLPYICYKDAVNKKSNQANIGIVKSSNLCLHGDTLVVTKDGHFPIKDLVGKEVEIYDGVNWVKNSSFTKTGTSVKLLNVKLRDGQIIQCTPEHFFPLEDGTKIRASELVKGQRILTHQASPDHAKEKLDAAYVKGFMIGDGTALVKDGKYAQVPILQLYYTKTQCMKRIMTSVSELAKKLKIRNSDFKEPVFVHEDKNERFSLRGIATFKEELIDYCRSYKKSLPNFIFNKRESDIFEFISGVMDADGTALSSTGVMSYQIASTEEKFLRGFKELLKTLGINSSISLLFPAQVRDFGEKKGGKYMCADSFRITISNQSARKLAGLCHFNRLTNFGNKTLGSRSGTPYKIKPTFNEIESISESTELSDTYCTNVPSTNNFALSCGLMSGNCAEITEVSDTKETAVCNLASINLSALVKSKEFDFKKLAKIVKIAIRNLNKVIDLNHYPTKETKLSNSSHRPVGLGVQGLADVFFKLGVPYDSEKARELNKEIFENMYLSALEESCEQAILHGAYSTFKDSPASQGILQYDMWGVTPKYVDYTKIKEKIQKHGLRNSLLLAMMPTASTASILGNCESFEALTSNLYTRSVLSGEFVQVNRHLVKDLDSLGLWNDKIKEAIISNKGSIQAIDEIPAEVREVYKTVWEISNRCFIDMAKDRGAFICQSQSMNLYLKNPNIGALNTAHFYGWKAGLKTGMYYLRMGSAVDAVSVGMSDSSKKDLVCSIDNKEDCEACGS